MKLTKYEHACLGIEINDKKTIIDPGAYTTNIGTPTDVSVIIVTHEHADHLDVPTIKRILAANPDLVILGHKSLSSLLDGLPFQSVSANSIEEIGPFQFGFFGGEHAAIHTTIPQIANLGVMVNNTLYYPGDSFAVPTIPAAVLALPVSAPWLKLSEAIDFMIAIQPTLVFPTHDALLSQNGDQLIDRLVSMFAEKNGAEYRRLYESVEL